MKLTLDIIDNWSDLDELEPDWNPLLAKSSSNHIFSTWEWCTAWINVHRQTTTPFVITVRDQQRRLIGLAPLYISSMRLFNCLSLRTLRFIGDRSSGAEYPAFICPSGMEQSIFPHIWRHLLEHRKCWDCMWIPNIATWELAFRHFIESLQQTSGLHFHQRGSGFSSITLPTTFDAYMATLSKSRRREIKRHARALGDPESLTVRYCNDSFQDDLQRFFDLHNRRWQAAGQTGSFVRDPKLYEFYLQFLPLAHARGWLNLSFLEKDHHTIATQLGYQYNNHFYAIQEGYDPEAPAGAANHLRQAVIGHCIEQGCSQYDFLGHITPHKLRWGAIAREGCDLMLWHRSLKTLAFNFKPIWPTGRFIHQP